MSGSQTSLAKKRNYYKSSDGTSSSRYKMFLVRYYDLEQSSYACDGPYGDQKQALDIVHEYLKNGVCSWMVTYNE